ncbi:N-acetyltransferase [Paenibacillus sp. KS-LC4]|uniref:GNAT family N-acetyltransferase n=1 Tax=Paenibacillus sp. KS-LC4 TaxID=2979727 RepID=UPI0030CFB6EF
MEALQMHPESFSSSYEEEKEYPLEPFLSRLQAKNSFTFGVFENSQLYGIATLVMENKIKLKHRAHIYSVYVARDKRGRGYAKNLMLQMIKKAKSMKGIEQIHLTVASTNEAAKNLYTALEFKTYGIQKQALKIQDEYFDEELMCYFF